MEEETHAFSESNVTEIIMVSKIIGGRREKLKYFVNRD